MAKLPVEIIVPNEHFQFRKELYDAIAYANALQEEFSYELLSTTDGAYFEFISLNDIGHTREILQSMDIIRKQIKGFHPFLLLVVENALINDDFSNLFGGSDAKKGLSIVTTSNVADVIMARDKMMAYFLYYLARYTLSFILPFYKGHLDTRGCVYDKKIDKKDLLKSIRPRAFCPECEIKIISAVSLMSKNQFSALNTIFGAAGDILYKSHVNFKDNQIAIVPELKEIVFGGNVRIRFEPLLFAIYLLFLRNMEGIKPNELNEPEEPKKTKEPTNTQQEEHKRRVEQYDEDLKKYEKHLNTVFSIHDRLILSHKRDNDSHRYNRLMIKEALGPRKHEKIARINRMLKDAFTDKLIAQQFEILGERSKPKKIEAAKFNGCKEYVDQIIDAIIGMP